MEGTRDRFNPSHDQWRYEAFEHGITPIICCGESLTQRKQGIYIDWIRMQIKIAFQNVTADQAKGAALILY